MRWTVYNHVKAVPSLNVAAITATANGAAVDLDQTGQDFRVATLMVISGTVTDGTFDFKVQESADGSTGWTDVPAERIQGTNPAYVAADDNDIQEVGIIPDPGSARFLRAVCTVGGAPVTGGVVGAVFLLGQPNRVPVVRD